MTGRDYTIAIELDKIELRAKWLAYATISDDLRAELAREQIAACARVRALLVPMPIDPKGLAELSLPGQQKKGSR